MKFNVPGYLLKVSAIPMAAQVIARIQIIIAR